MIVFLIPVNLLRERGFVLHRNTAAHKSHCKQKDILFFSFLILLIILYCVGISLMRDYGECICGFLVLRYENGGVVGYDFTYRQMIDLKKDGTFGYLYGVADTGYARLNFTDDSWEYIKICNVTETSDTVTFFYNGQEVSKEAYWEAVAEQDSKEEVEWLAY